MSSAVTPSIDPDVGEAIVGSLRAAEEPLSIPKIRGSLSAQHQLPDDALARLLERLVAAGRAFHFSPYRSEGPRYWHGDAHAYARQVIEKELATAPLSASALDKKVATRLADCPPVQRKEILEQLAREGRVYQLPPLPGERSAVFSARPPDPRDYLRPEVEALTDRVMQLAQRLRPVGVRPRETIAAVRDLCLEAWSDLGQGEPEEVLPAPAASPTPATGDAETIEESILRLAVEWTQQHRHGGLISLRELWQAMAPQCPEKADFDAAVLKLGREGKAWLYRHDFAASLSEADRRALVQDNQGNYYNGISLRD